MVKRKRGSNNVHMKNLKGRREGIKYRYKKK
jgi:hypothetical protein